MVAMPGLVNAHTHSGQNLDRGVAPNLPARPVADLGRLRRHPVQPRRQLHAGHGRRPGDVADRDCTAVLDHPGSPRDEFDEHIDAVMSGVRRRRHPRRCGADDPGPGHLRVDVVRATRARGTSAVLGSTDPAIPHRAHDARSSTAWQGTHARLIPMVGPSAPQRCSDELMRAMADLTRRTRRAVPHPRARDPDPDRRHPAAVRSFGRWSSSTSSGLMTPSTSLAHCVWMDADEYGAVRDSGVTIVHNPISNLRCGSGLLPLADLLGGRGRRGDRRRRRSLERQPEHVRGHEVRRSDPHPLRLARTLAPGRAGLGTCLRGGCRCAGSARRLARAGMLADVVLLDPHRHVVLDRASLVASLVFAEHGESVHTVIVGRRGRRRRRPFHPGRPAHHRGRCAARCNGGSTKRCLVARPSTTGHVEALTAVHEHGDGPARGRPTARRHHAGVLTEPGRRSVSAAATDRWLDNEHPALRRCWHPVAPGLDLIDGGPIWRSSCSASTGASSVSTGVLAAFPDACPHRGRPLSAGTIVARHAPVRATTGTGSPPTDAASRSPPPIPNLPIPRPSELSTCRRRHRAPGTDLARPRGSPVTPLPVVPEHDDPAFVRCPLPSADWNASAAQMADNFLDLGHLPFLHTRTRSARPPTGS